MDGSMPGMNGMDVTRLLRELQPSVRVIALTLYEELTYLEEMIAAGAKGYVLKTEAPVNLAKAIRAVAAGDTFFDKLIPRSSSAAAPDELVHEKLNADELAIVKRLADGQTNIQIAADLKLALPVVEKHRNAAMKKLGLRSRADLVRVAALRKWLDA
jgi:DNA-binding NarL/FixJ family response regulator